MPMNGSTQRRCAVRDAIRAIAVKLRRATLLRAVAINMRNTGPSQRNHIVNTAWRLARVSLFRTVRM